MDLIQKGYANIRPCSGHTGRQRRHYDPSRFGIQHAKVLFSFVFPCRCVSGHPLEFTMHPTDQAPHIEAGFDRLKNRIGRLILLNNQLDELLGFHGGRHIGDRLESGSGIPFVDD